MKFLVAEPRVPGTPLSRRFLSHWYYVTQPFSLEFFVNYPGEIHGEVLNRIWSAIRYDSSNKDKKFIISELDFALYPKMIKKLEEWPWKEHFLFCPYLTRYMTRTSIEYIKIPNMPVASFMAMNLNFPISEWPPLDWLDFGGPHKDAGNLALEKGLESGFIAPNDYLFFDFKNLYPPMISIEHPGVGVHFLWSTYYAADPNSVLVQPFYRVGEHVAHCLCFMEKFKKWADYPIEEAAISNGQFENDLAENSGQDF